MRRLLGLIALMGLMGLVPVKPILSINPVHAQDTHDIRLRLAGGTFFIDNEYFGDRLSGYTLPGFVLQPKVTWDLHPDVTLSGGVHWLHYWGARDYPAATAYGAYPVFDSAGRKVHLLPFLQAEIRLSQAVKLTVGCLDGTNHMLPAPLYNFERRWVADPEAGFQLTCATRWVDLDVWTDWREFIWDHSPVPERFTAGASARLMLDRLDSTGWQLYLPLHFVAQHEGGQNMSVDHTINNNFNGAAGLGLKVSRWKPELDISCRAMWYHQHGNAAIPFGSGWGVYPQLDIVYSPGWFFRVSYWHGKDFVPLMGSWHFSNLSANTAGLTFDRTRVITLHGARKWDFGDSRRHTCRLTLYAALYHYLPSTGTLADGTARDYGHRNQIAAGCVVGFNPSIILR